MKRVCPGFYITEMSITLAWYRDFLGFECTFQVEGEREPPYAIVSRDEISIHLSLDRDGISARRGFCYIEADDVERLYKEFGDAGVIVARPLEESSYGMKDFVIKDYEGNLLSFGESVD